MKMGKKKRQDNNQPLAFKSTKPSDLLTIMDGFEIWREHHLVDKSGSRLTADAYKRDALGYSQYLESKTIEPLVKNVTEDLIRAYFLSSKIDSLAPNTEARAKYALRSIFGYLRERKIIESNPARILVVPKHKRRPVTESKVISAGDRRKISFHTLGLGMREHLIFKLGSVFGARPEQIRRLRWSGIDFAKRVISFPVIKRGDVAGGPIPNKLLEELERFFTSDGGSQYVFRSREGEPISYSRMKSITKKIVNCPGLTLKYKFRELRTTVGDFVSTSPGCNTKTVQELLGQADEVSPLQYQKAHNKALGQALDNLYNVVDVSEDSRFVPNVDNKIESLDKSIREDNLISPDVTRFTNESNASLNETPKNVLDVMPDVNLITQLNELVSNCAKGYISKNELSFLKQLLMKNQIET